MADVQGIDVESLVRGDRRALARAITLIESTREEHQHAAQALLESLLPRTGKSLRIGVTGVPGAGKSTFIEAFGLHLLDNDRKVAVLAVDPSSPNAGGSILGDKTRMERLSRAPNAFIRPSPAAGSLGGVAHKTRESMLLCEAAGYDVIVVETVGVGQSEFEVASMVDFSLVLLLPNAGDELQGIKRGIMEIADALVVNKADADSIEQAEQTRSHYENAVRLLSSPDSWTPPVMTCSALRKQNIDGVWKMILEHHRTASANGRLARKRAQQNAHWMRRLLHELIERRLRQNEETRELLATLEQQVVAGELTPQAAAKRISSAI
jgi:LAO/AO transport system kinase